MRAIRITPNSKKAMLKSTVPIRENITLVMDSNVTTIIVGINIHLLSNGFLSAISNIIPQEKAMADTRPIGYTISVNPILSGINTKMAMPKSAIAALQ